MNRVLAFVPRLPGPMARAWQAQAEKAKALYDRLGGKAFPITDPNQAR